MQQSRTGLRKPTGPPGKKSDTKSAGKKDDKKTNKKDDANKVGLYSKKRVEASEL